MPKYPELILIQSLIYTFCRSTAPIRLASASPSTVVVYLSPIIASPVLEQRMLWLDTYILCRLLALIRRFSLSTTNPLEYFPIHAVRMYL